MEKMELEFCAKKKIYTDIDLIKNYAFQDFVELTSPELDQFIKCGVQLEDVGTFRRLHRKGSESTQSKPYS